MVDTPIYGQSVYDFTVALIILINHCNFFIDCVCSKGSLLWAEVLYERVFHILFLISCLLQMFFYTLTTYFYKKTIQYLRKNHNFELVGGWTLQQMWGNCKICQSFFFPFRQVLISICKVLSGTKLLLFQLGLNGRAV